MSWDYEDYQYDYGDDRTPNWKERKIKSGNPDLSKHYPNKNESKLVRRLMSQTGLTEEELREHKKYRKILSEEQKKKGSKTPIMRIGLTVLKWVLRELKLPKEHPMVIDTLNNNIINATYKGYYYEQLKIHRVKPQQIIEWSNR